MCLAAVAASSTSRRLHTAFIPRARLESACVQAAIAFSQRAAALFTLVHAMLWFNQVNQVISCDN